MAKCKSLTESAVKGLRVAKIFDMVQWRH